MLEKLKISASYIDQAPEFMSVQEHQTVLRGFGIDPDSLSSPNATITGQQFVNLLTGLDLRYEGDYPPSLMVAENFNMAKHGLLGLAVMTSSTIEDALQKGMRYTQLVMPLLKLEFIETPVKKLCLLPYEEDVDLPRTLIEVSLGVCKHFLCQASESIQIEEIQLAYTPKYSIDYYEAYFGCPVQVNAPVNSIRVAEHQLNARMAQADERTAGLLEQQLEQQLEQSHENQVGDASEQTSIVSLIERYLDQRQPHLAEVPKQEVADYLNLTVRTLTRRLAKENSSYRAVLESKILTSVQQRLINTTEAVESIALDLGFQDAKSMSRLFKKLTEMSPSEYRKRHQTP